MAEKGPDKTNPSGKWTKPTTGSVRNLVASSSGVRWYRKKRSEIDEERQALERSQAIDISLKEDRELARRDIKMILFGAGEFGKSTILKQMRIIHNGGFTSEDQQQLKPIVYSNTIQSLVAIVRAMTTLNIEFGETEREADAKMLLDVTTREEETEPFSADLLSAMKRLWTDNGVQECFSRSNEYQLSDSAKYFLDDLTRLGDNDYLPTEHDILRTRVKSNGFVDELFQCKCFDGPIRLIDAGGLARKKWVHYFERGVYAVIFCVAMSESDQMHCEGETTMTNRLHEGLKLLKFVDNWFLNTSSISFIHRMGGLLQEKDEESPLNICFPPFPECIGHEASVYVHWNFEKQNEKGCHCYQIYAPNKEKLRSVFVAVTDVLVANSQMCICNWCCFGFPWLQGSRPKLLKEQLKYDAADMLLSR